MEPLKQQLVSLLFRLTPEDKRKINMKKKQIHMALGMLCHAKICIGSCDYYACLSLWKLMKQDYLTLHKMQLEILIISIRQSLYREGKGIIVFLSHKTIMYLIIFL